MESCPQKANRVTVNTQRWVHHLHLPPPPPPHLWTTLSPILQILPNLSSTVVRVTKKPGISFSFTDAWGGWDGGRGLSLLSEGHLSCSSEQQSNSLLSTRSLLFPAGANLFPFSCSGPGLEAHLLRNIMMLSFQTLSCPMGLMPSEPNTIACTEALPLSRCSCLSQPMTARSSLPAL